MYDELDVLEVLLNLKKEYQAGRLTEEMYQLKKKQIMNQFMASQGVSSMPQNPQNNYRGAPNQNPYQQQPPYGQAPYGQGYPQPPYGQPPYGQPYPGNPYAPYPQQQKKKGKGGKVFGGIIITLVLLAGAYVGGAFFTHGMTDPFNLLKQPISNGYAKFKEDMKEAIKQSKEIGIEVSVKYNSCDYFYIETVKTSDDSLDSFKNTVWYCVNMDMSMAGMSTNGEDTYFSYDVKEDKVEGATASQYETISENWSEYFKGSKGKLLFA